VRFGNKKAETETDEQAGSVSEPPKGLLRPQSSAALLSTPRRQLLLQHIWQRTSLSRGQFARLYRAPIERYAALVQLFPASEAHHHAYAGGMLDHGLEIVAFGLKLRQSYLLPIGAAPEVQAAQAEAWTAATAYAALLHDIGKVAVDLHVEYADGAQWHPWHGQLARPYRFRFRADRMHRLHEAAAGLLYSQVLGEPIFDWLSGFPELWAALLYVLAGRYEHAGTLGELVMQADRASVAQALGGDPAKTRPDAQQSLQRKLLDGLRYLVRERFKLNQPQASDGWLTQDALWLVSKPACDKLRAHLLSNGISGVPEKNTVLFDVLQEHGLVQVTPEGKAIWSAHVVGENGWSQEFTFLKLAPPLIWDTGDRPPPFRGSVRTSMPDVTRIGDVQAMRLPDIRPTRIGEFPTTPMTNADAAGADPNASAIAMLDDGDPPPTGALPQASPRDALTEITTPAWHDSPTVELPGPEQAHGERFLSWLQQSVRRRRLIVNDAKALIHSVDGTAFLVTPGVFQRFFHEHPLIRLESQDPKHSGWPGLQKSFERLGRHRKQPSGLNIWTCEVSGPRKTRRVHGYLLLDGLDVFAELPPDNPYLTLIPGSAVR
jgi:integrating conjugative element relaxase (TIGR03760 family)